MFLQFFFIIKRRINNRLKAQRACSSTGRPGEEEASGFPSSRGGALRVRTCLGHVLELERYQKDWNGRNLISLKEKIDPPPPQMQLFGVW